MWYVEIINNKIGARTNSELAATKQFAKYIATNYDTITGKYNYDEASDSIIDITNTPEYLDKQHKTMILEAKALRDAIIDSVTNSALIDILQLKAGEITQQIYDDRLIDKAALYTLAKNNFYTTTGLTPPVIEE